MIDKLSEWKMAKELCESINHLETPEKIKYIKNSTVSQSIKTKALNLIEKFNNDFDLIESVAIDKITINKENNLMGKNIDDYELIEIIGSGGMSTVYKARRSNQDIQKFVAIKVLSSHLNRDKYLELFIREQTTLSQLNHPNIVSMHHGGKTSDGINYLVMDYIDVSNTITAHAIDKKLTLRQKIELIITAAKAIAHAHKNNIIHRDIKPENIVIDENGILKIVDFGSAQLTKNTSEVSTKVFTPLTASPEQIRGKRVDERTDIFSLGIVLLDIFIQPLSEADTTIDTRKLKAIEAQKHSKKILTESKLDKELKNIINMATHIEVDKRYQKMDLFINDLNHYLQNRPIAAGNDSKIYRIKKFIQRNPLINALVLLILIVSISTIVINNNKTSELQQAEEKNSRYLAMIDALFEQADPFKSKKNTKDLIQTLEKIRDSQQSLLDADAEFRYYFYKKMALMYHSSGYYQQALESKRITLDAVLEFMGPDHVLVFDQKTELLYLLHANGKYSETIIEAQKLLKELKSRSNPWPVLTLITYTTLSDSYSSLNQLDKADETEKMARAFMYNHPEIKVGFRAETLSSMALSQTRRENYSIASELFEEVIDIYKSLGNRQKSLSLVMANYAVLKKRIGDVAASEKLFLESIEIMKVFDPKHLHLGSNYMRYAIFLSNTHRIDEAQNILQNATKIFIEANDPIELSLAYTWLVNFALKKNNIEESIKNIKLGKDLMLDHYSVDNPNILYKYNLYLWLLMLEPLQHYAMEIIAFLDTVDFTRSSNSKEYEVYQVQKALLTHKAIANKQDISIISQYLYGENLTTDKQKTSWLKQQITQEETYPALVKAFLHVSLLAIVPNESEYTAYCQNPIDWIEIQELALKINLIKQCIAVANQHNYQVPSSLTKTITNLDEQIQVQKKSIENFVKEVTSINTKLNK